jgi:hypothetical protein
MGRRSNAAIATACLGAAAGAGGLLLRFPPAQHAFYPLCPIHRYLHVLCPGCGATRALAALLRGHVSEAIYFNAFFVVLLPFLVSFVALCCYRAVKEEAFHWPEPPRSGVGIVLVAGVIFTVARNLF